MKFTSVVELGGKTATGIPVPAEIVEALGSGKKPAVTVTINGFSYQSSVASRGRVYLIPISAERRAGAGVEAGDEIEVELELDTAPRVVDVPVDFADALSGSPTAKANFEKLSYSAQSRWVLNIEGTKIAETRARRIAKAIESLTAEAK